MNIRPATDADRDRIVKLNAQAFNTPARIAPLLRDDILPSDWRVAEINGSVAAVLRTIDFAHFFGGRAVPAAGIAGVSVSPEHRGRGVGAALLRETLTEMRATGRAISSLFPATVPIYRAAGYGFAFAFTVWEAALDALPQGGDVEISEFGDEAIGDLNAAYERFAVGENGLIKRDLNFWRKRVLHSMWQETEPYRYLVRENGEVTGWIIYSYEAAKTGEWRFELECRDLHWTTPRAARALLSLVTLHRSTAKKVHWVGPPSEPLADLTAEASIKIEEQFRMMVRLLDVPAAIEARGYAPEAEAAVTIAVTDPMFRENAGPWLVQAAGGRAKVATAIGADARADAATWGSIWSGMLRARDAVRLGALEATPQAIETLEMLFAGRIPWLADFY